LWIGAHRELGIQPAPENNIAISFTFDGSFPRPVDFQWENCRLPSSTSNTPKHVHMIVAIFMY